MSCQTPKDLSEAAYDMRAAINAHNDALIDVERYEKYSRDAKDKLDAATRQLKSTVAAFDAAREWLAHSGPKTMRSCL